ncbi:MAG TPA: hypothetical protein DCM86_00480, partial [Verrucomicrobiales bacterium]|nr:hypothetical protein [Verrucomicrobiales bacterium]
RGLLAGTLALLSALPGWTSPRPVPVPPGPRIDRIERYQAGQVLIHFDTEPNATYELQYTVASPRPALPDKEWITLWTAPKLPFPNHYIYPDDRVGGQRFYRLLVLP